MAYTRASPEVTFVQVEQSLRESEMNTHLIGKVSRRTYGTKTL